MLLGGPCACFTRAYFCDRHTHSSTIAPEGTEVDERHGEEMRKTVAILGFALGIVYVLMGRDVQAEPIQTSTVTALREGNDFATRVLGDPWDMNEFSDVSTSLNNAGRNSYVINY